MFICKCRHNALLTIRCHKLSTLQKCIYVVSFFTTQVHKDGHYTELFFTKGHRDIDEYLQNQAVLTFTHTHTVLLVQIKSIISGIKVATFQHNGCEQGPGVQGEAEPAGHDLDPDGGPGVDSGLEIGAWFEPVGEGHHDVEGGQEKHEMEAGVGVSDSRLLIVIHPLSVCFFIAVIHHQCLIVVQHNVFTHRQSVNVAGRR